MKFLYLNAALVVLTFSTGAAPVADDNDDLGNTIRSLQHEMEALRAVVSTERHEMEALKAVVSTERERVQLVETENADLRRALNNAIGSWAKDNQMTADSMFLATINESSVSISNGEAIVWDSAPINPGGHFNTILGMYEAPVNGYYQFSVTKRGDQSHGTFYFLVDEVQYAYKNAGFGNVNGAPSGSATINIELTAGQVVRIENIVSTTIYGTDSFGVIYSWFTGHLLYAL